MMIRDFAQALEEQVSQVIVGKSSQIRLITAALLADGHVLLDDLPGSGKTTLVKTLSTVLGCSCSRIQFVPDLLPADILGAKVFNQKAGDFEYTQGPIVANLLLADEINRAIPRTQSALLEAMEERQITVDGSASPLPHPFLVLATQNPIEMESTFPLPAAQLDRFFLRLSLGYLSEEDEITMLTRPAAPTLQAIADPQALIQLQEQVKLVVVNEAVRRYIVQLVQATRSHPALRAGASPRASLCLYRGAQAWAAMQGRTFATPDDVQALAGPVLCHRLVLTGEAAFGGKTAEAVLDEIMAKVAVPPARREALLEH